MTESVFSMDGDRAPLVEIAVLCEKYDAHLIVDEAHATGVIGERGAGAVQAESCSIAVLPVYIHLEKHSDVMVRLFWVRITFVIT